MSESEEENFCFFGKPLEQYDEDSIPKRRPISVEEQIATDAQGRRRFHGAFTGGFSAGHFNTVGTPEGWLPSEFKSSRQEKSHNVVQKPEDFMDDEDLGEHGIAPQVVRATKDYSTSKKRKKQTFNDGPIPGVPVLHTLLTSGNETVGYLLLKNIGIKDKVGKQMDEVGSAEVGKVYGCQMPKNYEISKNIEELQYEIPEIYKECLSRPKNNTFGLGYESLDKVHINLFKTSNNFVVSDKNKKLSIRGQAFGVGAFEEEDEDIYLKEDMSNYDFELTNEKQANKNKSRKILIFDMFIHSKAPLLAKKTFSPPTIPHSFTGKHKIRKSRFEPIPEENENTTRSQINPSVRAKYLGENSEKEYTCSKSLNSGKNKKPEIKKEKSEATQEKNEPKSASAALSSVFLLDKFVAATKKESLDILEKVEKIETIHGTEQMRDAVKMKMFGPLTRTTSDWAPNGLLCKRFNVPEPFADPPEKARKRTKNLIFQPQKEEEPQPELKPGLSIQKEIITIDLELSTEETIQKTQETIDISSVSVEAEPSSSSQQNQPSTSKEEEVILKEEVEELNLPKDITEKVDVEKNTDLFKAIFLDSSESESENEEEQKDKDEELKSVVLADSFIPKIKPMKEGILSDINFHMFSKPNKADEEQNKKDEEERVEEKEDDGTSELIFGPKMPPKNLEKNNSKVDVVVLSNSEDEWVEKGNEKKKKKHKKEKKHKNDKEKHKKGHKHDKKKKHRDRD